MVLPDHVRELHKDILEREGGRKDDVEFTFKAGRWNHLGEATLMNRIKSHPDVGERWYPEQLKQIRHEQAQAAAAKLQSAPKSEADGSPLDAVKQAQTIEAH